MRAGRMRHVIDIQRKVVGQDPETGAPTTTWTNFLSPVPADIVPLSGREWLAAQQVNSEINTRIEMRYAAGIVSTMRAIDQAGTIYDIRAVLPDRTGRRHINLMCTAGPGDGGSS